MSKMQIYIRATSILGSDGMNLEIGLTSPPMTALKPVLEPPIQEFLEREYEHLQIRVDRDIMQLELTLSTTHPSAFSGS